MTPFRPRKRHGFTLIELLTVVAIIGILAAMVTGVTLLVKSKARVAASKSMYQQWATGLEQYKAAYGLYPYIGDKRTDGDRFVDLSSMTNAAEFIKCLTGKTPLFDSKPGQPLEAADAKKFNKRGEEFCAVGSDALQIDDASGQYTKLLADRFGNSKIRIYMDADGNGIISPVPAELSALKDAGIVNNAIAAKVIIYTLKADGADYADVLSWQ